WRDPRTGRRRGRCNGCPTGLARSPASGRRRRHIRRGRSEKISLVENQLAYSARRSLRSRRGAARDWRGAPWAKRACSKGGRTGTELLVIPGNPTSAAILSLANVSAGPPGSRSARLAAAASQSTCARDNCGLFISSAGAALAMNRAMPTRRARFNPASLVLPASRDQSDPRVYVYRIAAYKGRILWCRVPATPTGQARTIRKMTVHEVNLTAASSADREPEIMESSGTARLHATL